MYMAKLKDTGHTHDDLLVQSIGKGFLAGQPGVVLTNSIVSTDKEKDYNKLLAWAEVTNLSAEKKGTAVALSLPEPREEQNRAEEDRPEIFKIRGQVFDQIPLESLKVENGLQTLIDFLDENLGKDDLVDCLEKYEEFDSYTRKDNSTIGEYIAEFNIRYRRIEKKKINLPPEILAYQLVKRAKLSEDEKLLVLTGMNYSSRETLYEQAKTSLKKFKGWEMNRSTSTKPAIKLEPAFLAEHEEALNMSGYVRRDSSYNRGGYRGNNSRGCRGGYIRGNVQRGAQGRFSGTSIQKVTKKINDPGPDGNPLRCPSCGSYRHLMADCPDSYENMFLFTGYQKNDVSILGKDAQNFAVLESACSGTVCGSKWMKNYMDA
ncbi:hypothetical protein LOTGIDRAFT_165427 [Lottia gigantea]|uniref:Uncharacterized protein n=1 Tax=Lottia gigantea TaxID=225164 RepID=V3ZC65_LOTGI|nr:hypothetical protein LOTGIDRAFT_165427 [Lottia gigantea]ESO88643.1 hypothetical protein LOTGIDRAFT_165427 [Lottia gigantea]